MDIYRRKNSIPVWFSFENKKGSRHAGGMENHGAKAHACENFAKDEEKTLCDIDGAGFVRRMWITISDRTENALKNIYVRMYWDKTDKPAVDVPIGDFFCMGHGQMFPFENELFSSPEGRSFVCNIVMPFKCHSKIALINMTGQDISHIFFDMEISLEDVSADDMYFHATYTISSKLPLGKDPVILPEVTGTGCFVGTHISVAINQQYTGSWWGEGEVKMYIDGDTDYPTLVGTGTEDYIGTAWGQGVFFNRYQGCTILNDEKASFYRFHIPDPIYFKDSCRVTIQNIGGAGRNAVEGYLNSGLPCIPVTSDYAGKLSFLYKTEYDYSQVVENSWVNFYRQDDFYIIAYYYSVNP